MVNIIEKLTEIKKGIDAKTSKNWGWMQLQDNFNYVKGVGDEIGEVITKYEEEAEESEKLQGELETKQKEADKLQEELVASQNNAKKLKQEITDLEARIVNDTNDSEKEKLKKELVNKKKRLENAAANIKLLEEKRSNLDKEMSRLQEALIKKSQEGNQQSAELRKQLIDSQNQLNKVRKEAREAKEKAEQERDARPDIKKEDFENDYSKRPTQEELEQAVRAKEDKYKDYIASNDLEKEIKKIGLEFTQEDVNNAVKTEQDKWAGFISPDKLEEEAKKKGMVAKEENSIILNDLGNLKKQLEKVKDDKVKLEEEKGGLENEKAELLKVSQAEKEKLVKLEQQLAANQEKLNSLEQEKEEENNQKQELTKKITDLESEVERLKKKIKDLENEIAQLSSSDYEEKVIELEQEIFNLKNKSNTELEEAQKRLNDFIIGNQEKEKSENNQLKETDIEEIKQAMAKYLESTRKRLEEFQGLVKLTKGQEKEIYEKEQKKLKVEIEEILKLTNFLDSQFTAQIEKKVW